MKELRAKSAAWWHSRSARERAILLAWCVSTLVLLLWYGALAPLGKRIEELEKRLPQLESKLYAMRAQPLDSASVPRAGSKNAADLRSTLFRLLADRKVSAELRALSGKRVEMRLPELAMKDVLELLDFLRQESGARVVVLNAKSDAASRASRVVVELEPKP